MCLNWDIRSEVWLINLHLLLTAVGKLRLNKISNLHLRWTGSIHKIEELSNLKLMSFRLRQFEEVDKKRKRATSNQPVCNQSPLLTRDPRVVSFAHSICKNLHNLNLFNKIDIKIKTIILSNSQTLGCKIRSKQLQGFLLGWWLSNNKKLRIWLRVRAVGEHSTMRHTQNMWKFARRCSNPKERLSTLRLRESCQMNKSSCW